MRRSCHGKDDCVDIKWKGGEITHTIAAGHLQLLGLCNAGLIVIFSIMNG
jgi:hypothetical protein